MRYNYYVQIFTHHAMLLSIASKLPIVVNNMLKLFQVYIYMPTDFLILNGVDCFIKVHSHLLLFC